MSFNSFPEVSDSDLVSEPDWSSSLYLHEDKETWSKSLEKCYVKVPSDFRHFSFVFDPDTTDQISVKTKAAESAISFVMENYDKKFANGQSNEMHREVLNSRVTKFFCCLRTYHPLTLHLKVRNFDKLYHKCCFYSCPFGKGAKLWRIHHGIDYFGSGFT